MLQLLVPTAEDMLEVGRVIGTNVRPGDVIGLVGELGAGKTTLVQGIAHGLDIGTNITSPTFTLIKQYPGRIPLYHLDVYRLDEPEEIQFLGFDEILLDEAVVVIEWSDRIEELLPHTYLRVQITLDENARRRVSIEGKGTTYERVTEELTDLAGTGIRQCD